MLWRDLRGKFLGGGRAGGFGGRRGRLGWRFMKTRGCQTRVSHSNFRINDEFEEEGLSSCVFRTSQVCLGPSKNRVCCYCADGCCAIWFFAPSRFWLGPEILNLGDFSSYYANPLFFVSCGFRLQSGWCTSQAQNLRFRAQNLDLHRSDPQRSRTPKKRKRNRAHA